MAESEQTDWIGGTASRAAGGVHRIVGGIEAVMSDIVEIERDLEQAREHLVHTLDEMNRKATATAQELLLPEEPIRRHPIPALFGAMALGFAAGGSRIPALIFGMLAVGGALMEPALEQASDHKNGAR